VRKENREKFTNGESVNPVLLVRGSQHSSIKWGFGPMQRYTRQGLGMLCGVSVIGLFLFGGGSDVSAGRSESMHQEAGMTTSQDHNCGPECSNPPIPAKKGVPKTSSGGGILNWSCKNNPATPPPMIQCHPAYEDRMGCNSGGAGTFCDTVPDGGGGTMCGCCPNPGGCP